MLVPSHAVLLGLAPTPSFRPQRPLAFPLQALRARDLRVTDRTSNVPPFSVAQISPAAGRDLVTRLRPGLVSYSYASTPLGEQIKCV